MEKFLPFYGELPDVIGEIDIEVGSIEMCFIQYLPIKILCQGNEHYLPDNIKWCKPLLISAIRTEVDKKPTYWDYVYITVKRSYGKSNRVGWHCDGFGSDDVNYIWYDAHPTQFYKGELLELPHNHEASMWTMGEKLYNTDKIIEYPCKTLIRMCQSPIHRVNENTFTGLRTFVKISFSNSKYNLKGNAHNYLLDYDWEMVDRNINRNDPVGKIINLK